MLKTLHGYLAKELGRVCILAIVAMTLVMTVLAILEPLRKYGLGAGQVAEFFLYMLPVVLSFILPFAALFSTAIVYGRFTQDRELLACRASGISTGKLLQPAVAMGALVTILTLTLSNFVAPIMAQKGQNAIVSNLQRIFFHKLKKERSFSIRSSGFTITADRVNEKEGKIDGFTVSRRRTVNDKNGKKVSINEVFTAASASFSTHYDKATQKHYVSFSGAELIGPISSELGPIGKAGGGIVKNLEVPSFSRHKPSFYSWKKLFATIHDPTVHGDIHDAMLKVKRSVNDSRFLFALIDKINAGQAYSALKQNSTSTQYVLIADSAAISGKKVVLKGTKQKPVTLVIKSPDFPEERVTATRGEISCSRDQITQKPTVAIVLSAPGFGEKVKRQTAAGDVSYPEKAEAGADVPAGMTVDNEPLLKLYNNISDYTKDPSIIKTVGRLHGPLETKLRRKVIAEMHWRISYGTSCMLLVAMGAAIGVMFKGDHMLSAFAVSVIPAAVGFVLMYTGKSMISNPKSNEVVGIAIIWGSLGLLLLGDIFLYAKLSRR